MKWNYRSRFTIGVMLLISFSLIIPGAFLLHSYYQNRLNEFLKEEQNNIRHASEHIEHLLQIADLISPEEVKTSNNIILLQTNPCNSSQNSETIVSERFSNSFNALGLSSDQWTQSLALFKACEEFQARSSTESTEERIITVIPIKVQFMTSYLPMLIHGQKKSRFAMIAMDGFNTASGNTVFITDRKGQLIWAADGDQFLKSALLDTQLTPEMIKKWALELNPLQLSHTFSAGDEGLLSLSLASRDWIVFSLSYQPKAMKPVRVAVTQFLWFLTGSLLICLFFSRKFALLFLRPLSELKSSAESLTSGNFDAKFNVNGDDEISSVKHAFNSMIDKITTLLEETKEKASLESELEMAGKAQELLFPGKFVHILGHDIFSFIQPAAKSGGDWWNVLEIQRENDPPCILLVIGDVTGHGSSSALMTAVARGAFSVIESWSKENPQVVTDPRIVLREFNQAIYKAGRSELNMTFFATVIDPSNGTLVCSNAGHNRPYLIHSDSEKSKNGEPHIQAIGDSGIRLGQSNLTEFNHFKSYSWGVGSKLFLYTDGLLDSVSPDLPAFDRKLLIKSLKKNHSLKGDALLGAILKDRTEIVHNQIEPDDITALVCAPKVK